MDPQISGPRKIIVNGSDSLTSNLKEMEAKRYYKKDVHNLKI